MGSTLALPSRDPRPARTSRPDRRRPSALSLLMQGSEIRASHPTGRRAGAGPLLPALPAAGGRRLPRPPAPGAAQTLKMEANAATDNPLVLSRWHDRVRRKLPRRARRLCRGPDRDRGLRDRRAPIAQRRIALLVDPVAELRPARLPHAEARPEFRVHDRRGHSRGPDVARTSRCRIRLRSIRRPPPPTRRTTCPWHATARGGCWR